MPTYEYRCKTCGDQLEVAQSFRDDALTTCPTCGGELRKLFGSIGITFKGSGFYRTDSRSSSSSDSRSDKAEKSEQKPEKSETKADKSETTKSDKSDGKSSASEKSPSTSSETKSSSASTQAAAAT